MKKVTFISLFAVLFVTLLRAQTKSPIPDVNKLLKMTPAELEQYKKQALKDLSVNVKKTAEQNHIAIDESLLPDYELQIPAKDEKRLASIPGGIQSINELSNAVKKTKQELSSHTPASMLEQIKKLVQEKNPAQLQSASIAEWYSNNPVAALLLSMESVLKNPDTAIAWNNLAAFYNMSGAEEKAVPILKYWLSRFPANSLLLNNMGQAYLGLGDLDKAKDYLMQCLERDSLNPEANRSMAMMCLYKKEPEKAKEFVKKEEKITTRVSTDKQMENAREHVDVFNIFLENPRLPKKAYFEGIGLSKFKLPPVPERSDDARQIELKWVGFNKSIRDESVFWLSESLPSDDDRTREGKEYAGPYYRKAERILQDLYNNYTSILPLFRPDELEWLKKRSKEYGEKIAAIVCETPPSNSSKTLWDAYMQRCCQRKKPIVDAYIKEWNEFVKIKAERAISIWKQYIDGLANIAAICPCGYHKRMVCANLHQFFNMLAFAAGTFRFDPPPAECSTTGMTLEEAEQIIKTSRSLDLECPSWLNFEFDLQVAKVKGDCSQFAIEAGKGIVGAYEKDFKTGSSTIAGGIGMSQNFAGHWAEVEMKQMIFVTFDNNNTFTDVGLRGNAEISIGNTPITIKEGIADVGGKIASVEGGYSVGVNSGPKLNWNGKGVFGGWSGSY